MMLSDGIRHIGEGLLEVSAERLKGILAVEAIEEIYDVEQTPFARGKFATVRRATNKKTGVNFAAKFLRRRRRGQSLSKDIEHEIAILMLCADSSNIVKLHGVHETKTETALLLEMATGGELQAMIDEEGSLTEEQTKMCMHEILTALQYLHKKCIAHLDIKPQNILLAGEKIENGLKLCDFGISRIVEEGGKIREILGTPDYVAPEVLQYEPLSLQTDIWSIGVLSYVLLTGCSPFGGDTKQETFLNISKCKLTFPEELFEEVSSLAIDFIRCCLRIKPEDRMTVTECLKHRWLTNRTPLFEKISESKLDAATSNINEHDNNDRSECNSPSTSSSSCPSLSNETNLSRNSDEMNDLIAKSYCKSIGILLTNHKNISISSNNSSCYKQQSKYKSHKNNNNNNNQFSLNHKIINVSCEDKENIENLVTNYTCNTRELNLIIEDNNDENKLVCEKLSSSPSVHLQHPVSTPPNSSTITTPSTTTTSKQVFPDAPTTPKVCRKDSSASPSIVKQLVKQFQMKGHSSNHQNNINHSPNKMEKANEIELSNSISISSPTITTTTSTANCTSDPICRPFENCNGSKKYCIDQGIIC